MAGAIIGTVQSLKGLVEVRSADGKSTRTLTLGEELHEGEIILTTGGGELEISLIDGGVLPIGPGQYVTLTAEVSETAYPGPEEAQVASVDPLVEAVLEGGDLNELLEATAAGAGAGQGEGHTFVRLLRIAESTDGASFDSDPAALADTTAEADQTFTPVPNQAPVAIDDSIGTPEDTPITIPVLDNDSDIDGDELTIIEVTQGTNGTVTIDPVSGNPVYTPNENFNGTDSFTYTIGDGNGGTDTATVTVNVGAVNDAPDAVDDVVSTPEDTAITIPVLANDSDPDGHPLAITGFTQPSSGTVASNGDGTFTYTPNESFNGTDTFTYTISDGNGGTDTATVTVNVGAVNDPPLAVNDVVQTPEDTPITIGVLANDSDPDGDPLTITGFTQPANGTVTIVDGNPVYTPNPDFTGTDTFTYTISDGNGGSDTATVTINVGLANDPPIAVDDSYSTDEDVSLSISAASLLSNDSDIDGDTLVITGFTQPSHGTVVDNGDGTFTYAPDADYNGADSFTYTVSDGNGGTDTATVNLTVNPQNDPPIAVDDTYSTNEDAALVISAASLLSNDSDIDGDSLVITGFTQPSHGSVVDNGDGTFTYTPDADYNGADSFTYTVSDSNGGTDTATVNLTVNPQNDPPIAVDDSYSTNEDAALVISAASLLSNDSDVDGDTLVVSGFTQ
ncbi:MAG: retention module-containing protein, partial [Pseudomonadota bacterium]